MPLAAAAAGCATDREAHPDESPYPIRIGDDALTPAHVTVTVPVPGRALLPITQDQDTRPFPSAVAGVSPCAWLAVPAGVT